MEVPINIPPKEHQGFGDSDSGGAAVGEATGVGKAPNHESALTDGERHVVKAWKSVLPPAHLRSMLLLVTPQQVQVLSTGTQQFSGSMPSRQPPPPRAWYGAGAHGNITHNTYHITQDG